MKGKYRPELTIDMKKVEKEHELYSKFYNETKGYSITPTTFQGRRLKALDAPIFEEVYKPEHGKNSVTRFGLNVSSELCKEIVVEHNKKEMELLEEKDNPAMSNFSKVTTKKDNIKSFIKYSQENITKLERELLEIAIKNKDEIVLVDLFARYDRTIEENHVGKIKYNEDGSIETHSVVLIKQDGKYLVIDPNKATFSSILVGANKNIVVCFDKEFQIYKALDNKNIGPEQKQWRDCIDISAKLAFSISQNLAKIDIQEKDGLYFMDRTSLQKYPFVEDLTNNNAINQALPAEIKNSVFRAQQSSSVIEQKLSSVWLKVMHYVHKSVVDKVSSLKFNVDDPAEPIIGKFFKNNFSSHKHSISELKNLISVDMLLSGSTNQDEVINLMGLAKLECDNIEAKFDG